MTRRTALKAMGMLVVALAPTKIMSQDDTVTMADKLTLPFAPYNNYYFNEKGMGSIIIERTNGKQLTIPLSEIFDALEKGE